MDSNQAGMAAAGGSPPRQLTPGEVDDARLALAKLLEGLGAAIFGQTELLESVVICLLSRGHMLLEGLPGLGKTELVKSLAALLGLEFRRVQFTPDLLPSDISGAPVLEEHAGYRKQVFHRGPIFANLVLADEINRAAPKTQSALLEAMGEHRVTVLGESHALPSPFFVLATQNPIESAGTHPLIAAQLDRFLFKFDVAEVSTETLQQIAATRPHGRSPELRPIWSAAELTHLFDLVDLVQLPAAVLEAIAQLVGATHPGNPQAPEFVRKHVRYGASPRAAIALASAGRSAALLAGRPTVGIGEVCRVAHRVLEHRLILDPAAVSEGWTPHRIVDQLLENQPCQPTA